MSTQKPPFPFLQPGSISLDPNVLLSQLQQIIAAVNNVPKTLIASGLTPTGNGADTTDDTLQSLTIPANYFTAPGQTIRITATGTTAANGNNKQIKIKSGATTLMTSGTLTTNNGSWRMQLDIQNLASNSQNVSGQGISGTTVWTTSAAQTLTTTAAITINITGASGTTGAANDVVCNNMYAEIIS